MINMMLKKMLLAGLTVALAVAALPVTSAFAQQENPPTSNEKLEQAWARQTKLYERMGKAFENTDERLAKVQALIDTAAADGKDVSALQAAFDAFSAALTNARPSYESAKSIVDAHAGFDADGKVTDAAQAQATVEAMRAKMQEIKSQMNGTGKAFRDAIKAFRAANKPAEAPQKDS